MVRVTPGMLPPTMSTTPNSPSVCAKLSANRDFQGSVEAGGNLLLVFAGFHAPAFSTALLGCRADQLFSRGAIAAHYVRAVADRDGSIQVFVDRYRASRQAVAESCFVDLPPPVSNCHGVRGQLGGAAA